MPSQPKNQKNVDSGLEFDLDQVKRIINRYTEYNHKQQFSNMKRNFINCNYNTIMSKLLAKEIKFLNDKIKHQDKVLGLSKGDYVTYTA